MATLTGVTLIKQFTYRGDPNEEWSSKYWFKGPPPGDAASWDVLVTDILNIERPILPPTTHFARAYGYDNDDPHADHVYAHDYLAGGPGPPGTGPARVTPFSGDQAACVQWKTDKLNTRGKPIYLRKYMHAGELDATDHDNLSAGYHTALQTYAQTIQAYHGGLTNPTSEHHAGGSETAVTPSVMWFVTTRTLKRRGPRPKTGA